MRSESCKAHCRCERLLESAVFQVRYQFVLSFAVSYAACLARAEYIHPPGMSVPPFSVFITVFDSKIVAKA